MEVHFTPEQEDKLTQVARRAGTGAEELVKDAALQLLNRRRYAAAELAEDVPAPLSLDWSQCPAVESIPGKLSGAWVFKDTRTPVSIVFENLEDGMTIDEIMEQYPVTREQINAALEFAVQSVAAPSR